MKKIIKIVLISIIGLIFLLSIFGIIDYQMVKNSKEPVFCYYKTVIRDGNYGHELKQSASKGLFSCFIMRRLRIFPVIYSELPMNPVVLAVCLMLILSLARVHVVFSLIISAFVGGLVANIPAETILATNTVTDMPAFLEQIVIEPQAQIEKAHSLIIRSKRD